MSVSVESVFDMLDRDSARDAIVEVVCASLPAIANTVAHYALDTRDVEPHGTLVFILFFHQLRVTGVTPLGT